MKKRTSSACLQTFVPSDVHIGLKAGDKYEAIKMAGQALVDRGSTDESYVEAMIKREEISTTYIGEGVAIPHGVGASRDSIKQSGICVLQFPQGVLFGDENAYLIIGIAGKGDEHLSVLQTLTNVMLEDGVLDKLKTATDPMLIYRCLTGEK